MGATDVPKSDRAHGALLPRGGFDPDGDGAGRGYAPDALAPYGVKPSGA